MQNYGQSGYQRPGSTASFAGQPAPPPPPGYGAPQGYQSAAPQAQSQWAAPTPTQTSNSWNQQPQQQAAGGYNPNTYGAMPGGYAQGQQPPAPQPSYPPQQQDRPPPPPPKPYGFAGAVQNQQQQQQQQQPQNWPQQPQQNTGFTPQQQGGYPVQGTPQQGYNSAAPPPPSATPGGSYFPPAQQGGRPGSVYGANQVGPQQAGTVISPNEQQPAYIPPSLTGQGVQAYMPSNTNPAPGVYVPPPPDIPAWQQAQHSSFQAGAKKFKYTKPTVDPSFYAQGYQGVQPMAPQQAPPAPGQFGQQPMQPQQPQQYQQPYGQQPQPQFAPQAQPPQQGMAAPNQFQQQPQGQFGQPVQPQQQPYGQPVAPGQPQGQFQQGTQFPQQQNQWQSPPSADQGFNQHQNLQTQPGAQQPGQPQQWQPRHQAQGSIPGQQFSQTADQGIQAPKPLGRTDTAASSFFNQPSPQSQPVSPVTQRQSIHFTSGQQSGLGRTGSVSSIALANLQSQRGDNRTSSPKPASMKNPTPPPPRDDKSKFSALGSGGPSDWEHFGMDGEIDDEDFFAKKDGKKDEPAQLDSVELPAHVPSPPSTHGWPSPATHPAPLNLGDRKDTYAPTPPPGRISPAGRPQQGFVMGDAVVAPLRLSPKPAQGAQPPPTPRTFEMGDGTLSPPKQGTPAQHQQPHQPPPPQQGFVMGDGSWSAQSTHPQAREQTPGQQHQPHQPPPVKTGFMMNDSGWGVQTPTQASTSWGNQQNGNLAIELKAKDEAYERLHSESEKEKADLRSELERFKTEMRSEMEKLKGEGEAAKAHAAGEANVFHEQLETMKSASEQAKTNADALIKEKDMTIERLKEDAEGMQHNIEERDATIADLRRQLEVEKTKERPQITAADLMPEVNSWYVQSLERFTTTLRAEESAPEIEGKISTFKAFLKSESEIRGIPYYDAPPTAPEQQHIPAHQSEEHHFTQDAPHDSTRQQDLHVDVPQEPPAGDEYEYDFSPGGRPRLRPKAVIQSNESIPTQQHFNPSGQSTTVPTPASSVDDDTSSTPVQSLPEEPTTYKAYQPPAGVPTSDVPPALHRHSTSITGPPVGTTPSGPSRGGHDEIFFSPGEPEPPVPASNPAIDAISTVDVPVPAPLSLANNRSVSTAPPAKEHAHTLADLLPSQMAPVEPNPHIEEIRARFTGIKLSLADMGELTKTWEKSASLMRRKNDSARRARQEDAEERNEDLFNNNEITYAEMNQLEAETKEKEAGLKAQEDRDEYKTYVEAVFDPVYDGLQADIKSLTDVYIDAETLLHNSASGVKLLEDRSLPGTQDCLELLKEMHSKIEAQHDKVVLTVAERDKRYKKTEIQPLYAAGNIARMKSVEKHFEAAEKQAVVRAKRDKAERIGDLVNLAEEVVVRAVGVEQGEIDQIVTAIRSIDDGAGDPDLLATAHHVLTDLKAYSKSLLGLFTSLEVALNEAVLEAQIADARAGGADAKKMQELEAEKAAGAEKLKDEFERKVSVLDQDNEEIEELIRQKGGRVELNVEQEKQRRMKIALEEAKRRNKEF